MIELSFIDLLNVVLTVGGIIFYVIGTWMIFDWHKEFGVWNFTMPIVCFIFGTLLISAIWVINNVVIV